MMTGAYPSVVVRVVCALLSPFILVFGLYIVAHGHYGPGGGFAGGVFLAVAAILPRLTLSERLAYRLVPVEAGPIGGGVGMLLFLLCGVLPMLFGGAFLDYAAVEIAGMEPARVRYLGILVVEVGVGLAVFGAMVTIFDVLIGRSER
jgi:multicomponent Na+:H+ antiporter subunit B